MKKLSLSLLCASFALAASNLSPVVVSETQFEQPAITNVWVLTKKDLEQQGFLSLEEALSSLPNVSIVPNGVGFGLNIRGQDSDALSNKVTTRIKILIDGVEQQPQDNSHTSVDLSHIDINSIEQIELIPGGGSVIYGDGASGGVLHIRTKKPGGETKAKIALGLGSFGHANTFAQVSGEINDHVHFALHAHGMQKNGYQRNDKKERQGLGIKLGFLLNDEQRIDLNYQYSKVLTRTSNKLSKAELASDRRGGEGADEATNIFNHLNLSYTGKFDDFELGATAFYQDMSFLDEAFSDTKSGIKLKGMHKSDLVDSIISYSYTNNGGKRDSLRAKSRVSKKTHALSVLERFRFAEIFGADLGLRLERAAFKPYQISKTKTITSFGASLTPYVNYSEDGKAYLKIERGFNTPTSYQLTSKVKNAEGTAADYKTSNVKPETYLAFELGAAHSFGDLASLNAAIFLSDTRNELGIEWQSFTPGGGTAPGGVGGASGTSPSRQQVMAWDYINYGKTRRAGIELGAKIAPLEGLNINANISYLSAKVKKDDRNKAAIGQQIPMVPKFKLHLGANYKLLENLRLNAALNWQGSSTYYFKDKVRSYKQRSFALVDFGATYEPFEHFELSASVKNIFNKKYETAMDKERAERKIGDVPLPASPAKWTPGPGRSWYLQVAWKY